LRNTLGLELVLFLLVITCIKPEFETGRAFGGVVGDGRDLIKETLILLFTLQTGLFVRIVRFDRRRTATQLPIADTFIIVVIIVFVGVLLLIVLIDEILVRGLLLPAHEHRPMIYQVVLFKAIYKHVVVDYVIVILDLVVLL
jgi:hypothetical protein